jgi:L-ascorbate metabolism protein UlaG (beta-lactamase superfamily)
MEITWFGKSCFRLRGRGASVITDPFAPEAGYRLPRMAATLVTVSHDDAGHNHTRIVRDNPYVIQGPGEYEVGGMFVIGVAAFHDDRQGAERGKNTAYLIEFEEMAICHLGDLGHLPTQEQIEELDGIDILMVPVGGKEVLTSARAAEVVNLLEPKLVIPMRYRIPDMDKDMATVTRFLGEMNAKETEPQEALRVTASQLPDDTQVAVLAPRRQPG